MTFCRFGGGSRFLFAHRVALQRKSIAVMDQSVEDCIGKSRIFEVRMPLLGRQLACDQRGAPIVAIIEDLQEVAADLIRQRGEAEVIEDQQIRFGDLTQERRLGLQNGVARELIDESGKPEAADTVIGATGGVAHCTGEKAFADTGGSGDDDVEAFADPAKVSDLAKRRPIDPAGSFHIQILKRCGLRELGPSETLA